LSPEEERNVDETQKRERAQKVVDAKLGFIRHAIVYVMVIAGLAVVNNVTGGGYQWWLWPAFGWGLGLVASFISAFVFRSGALERKLVDREMEKLDE
jgi:hypothetical protein